MTETETHDMFGGDWGELDLNLASGAGAGRPGQVIRLHPVTRARHLDWLNWGLIPPATADDPGAPHPIHARAETVAELPMFAGAFRQRRAIVPATAYFLCRTSGTGAARYAITRKDGQPLAIAGLWEALTGPDRKIIRTYCIITVAAVGAAAEIHNRMPLVLEEKDWPLWLGEIPGDPATLMRPSTRDTLAVRPMPTDPDR
jgi:putative SOS response-associated peptidase YedK